MSKSGQYPPGMVMLPVGAMTRYTAFWMCLFRLKVPPGTRIAMTQGSSVAENQNIAARQMLADPKPQWAWIIGDDHTFSQDIIYKLLDRDLDFVSPLCAIRYPPFGPSVFRDGKDVSVGWDEIPRHHLMEVDATGLAGALVRRPVFEALDDPWFSVTKAPGDTFKSGEDIFFCKKARQAGFRIWLDPTQQVGHMTSIVVDPVQTATGWGVGLDLGSMLTLQVKFDNRDQQVRIEDNGRQHPPVDSRLTGAQGLDAEDLNRLLKGV